MRIIALECASVSASVAAVDGGRVLGEAFVKSGLTHSQTLMPMLEKVIRDNGIDIKTADLFACTAGPGSFTGVRIGVAALKGLADAAGKPCFGVSTLEAIAYPHRSFDGIVCPVMDARCNQVYTACFEGKKRVSDDEAMLIDELSAKLIKLGKPVLFSGDGAQLVYGRLSSQLDCRIADIDNRYPTALSVALLSEEKLRAGEKAQKPEHLLPVYLRLPQAQRELNRKNNIKGDK